MRISLLLAAVLVLSACDSGSSVEEIPQYFQAQMIFENMPPLDGGAAYEGWAQVDGAWMSIGRFNYDENGRLVDLSGRLIANTFITEFDLQPATEILVTIEGRRDADLDPSDTHVLRGAVVGSGAAPTFTEAVTDLSTAVVNYTVGTPTDSDPSNESFGIWLGTPGTYQPAATLPALGAGWQYELWAELSSGPASLGKFTDPATRDSAAPFSNQPETFAVPGESFVENPPAGETFPLDVSGLTIFLTVEPEPDDFEETPYGIRFHEATVPGAVTGGESLSMSATGALPMGTVQFR
ncbi:MAG: hypothetical protein HKN29_09530 [Rhodothermales bacterium]|nr:hypothetical protein [Rhodothermales bacterium]